MRYMLLGAAITAAIPFSSIAAAPQPTDVTTLSPVVVTATRLPQPVTRTLAPVTIITRKDIERLQPQSLPDLLSGFAGVDIANQGGSGQLTSLFLRGTNANETLVLVDGVRVGTVTSGGAAWEQIPVDQIARIEIVRGPRSSLYGADAIGGVIQIFTRHGTRGAGLVPAFHISGGTHDTWDGQVGLSGGSDHAWFNVSTGAYKTQGINSCKMGAGTVFAGCFVNEPDRDGNDAYNGLATAGYRWDNGTELTGTLLRTNGFVAYDGSYSNFSHHAQQVTGLHLGIPVSNTWKMTLRGGQSLDLADDYLDSGQHMTKVGYTNSERDQFGWLNDFTLTPDQLLSAGVDFQHDHVGSNTDYTQTSRDDTGVFAQYQGMFGANEIQLSAREDHNQQFGNHTTGAAAWGYHFANGLTLTASYATAFHAPTFNDLYYPSFPGFPPSSNPNLKPEKSRNAELDLGAHHAHWHWQASVYQDRIDDLIALDANFTPGNISSARIRGFDGEVGGHWQGWTWRTSATWMQPVNDDGGADNGNLLPRRFQRSVRLDLDRRLGTVSVGATFKAFSYRYDDAANTHRLGGYGLLDLRASWQFASHWQAEASIDNLLGHDYETVYYYNQPGRTAMLTLRYVP